MNIEELERELFIAKMEIERQRVHIEVIEEKLQELVNSKELPTFTPKMGKQYYQASVDNKFGRYQARKNDCIFAYQEDTYDPSAFQTLEQAQKACNYLNLLMPVLKYAIEYQEISNVEATWTQQGKMIFEIHFRNKRIYEKVKNFSDKMTGVKYDT